MTSARALNTLLIFPEGGRKPVRPQEIANGAAERIVLPFTLRRRLMTYQGSPRSSKQIPSSMQPAIYAKWRRLVPLGSMAVAIVLVLSGEMWVIGRLVGRLPHFANLVSSNTPSGALAIALGLMPLLSLAALLIALQMGRLFLPRDPARSE